MKKALFFFIFLTLFALFASFVGPTPSDAISVFGGTITVGDSLFPCYWTGTTLNMFNTGDWHGKVTGITVSDGTIYASGNIYNSSVREACYWIANDRTDLPGTGNIVTTYSTGIAVLNGIPCVSEGNVYIAGYYMDVPSHEKPCYWVNGIRYDLDTVYRGWDGAAVAICVENGNVYTGGYCSSSILPCWWFNSKLNLLVTGNYGGRGRVLSEPTCRKPHMTAKRAAYSS